MDGIKKTTLLQLKCIKINCKSVVRKIIDMLIVTGILIRYSTSTAATHTHPPSHRNPAHAALLSPRYTEAAYGNRNDNAPCRRSQYATMFLALILNHTKNKEVRINFRSFTPNWRTISIIYQVGVPSIIMQSISSVMTFGMNKILIGFSETAVAVFGVYFKLQSFIFMPIFGLNNGMIPIVAYNYGARSKKRIMETVWLSIGIAVGIMLIGLMVFHLMTPQLLMLFQADEEMLAIGVPALRIISLSFLFAGYCIIVGSVFQALGNGVYSLIISVARQLVCILPLAWFFARTFGLHAVWLSLPLAEITSVVLSSILFRKIYLDKIKPLGQAAA